MSSVVLLVATYKFRQFFGPILRSKKALALLALLLLFLLPSGFGLAVVLPDLVASPSALDFLALGASAALSVFLLLSVFGGLLVHPSEIDFLLTTPIRPRGYLLGDALFQLLFAVGMSGVFSLPFLLGLATVGGVPAARLVLLALAFVLFLAFAVLLGQATGVFLMGGGRRRLLLPATLLVLLNLPALQFLAPVPLRYGSLPLPSTAFAVLGQSLLADLPVDPLWPLLLAGYGVALVAFHAWVGGAYFFPRLRPTLSVAFMASPFQRAAVQQERTLRALSFVTRRVHLSPGGSLSTYLVRFHLVRLVRDGSLLAVLLMVALLSVITTVSPGKGPPAAVVTGMMGYFILLAVVILGFSWVTTERRNTWILLSAPGGVGPYFRALLLAFWVVGGSLVGLGGLVLALTGRHDPLGLLAAAAGFLAGAGALVFLLARLRLPTGGFSLAMLLLFVIPGLATGLGALPVLPLALLPGPEPLRLLAGAAYLGALAYGLLAVVRSAARRFRLEIPAPA